MRLIRFIADMIRTVYIIFVVLYIVLYCIIYVLYIKMIITKATSPALDAPGVAGHNRFLMNARYYCGAIVTNCALEYHRIADIHLRVINLAIARRCNREWRDIIVITMRESERARS